MSAAPGSDASPHTSPSAPVGRLRAVTARRWPVALVVLALVAGAVVGLRFWRADAGAGWAGAMAVLPAETTVVGLTDWAAIRSTGLRDPDERDVLTRSVLADEEALESALGWRTRDVDTEVYAQAPEAVGLVLDPAPSLGRGRVEGSLSDAGYTESSDGTWVLGDERRLGTGLSDVFAYVRPLPAHGLLALSPTRVGVDAIADTAAGRRDALTSDRAALDTATALAGSHSILLQAGTLACATTGLTDPSAAQQAEVAQESAGRLVDYRFSGRGVRDRGGAQDDPRAQRARFAMTFDEVGTARRQAGIRSALATGPFIGRTGQVEDLLRLRDAAVDSATLTLTFDHAPADGVLMVGTGPLLFASCPSDGTTGS